MKSGNTVTKVLGWAWFIFAGFAAAASYGSNGIASSIAFALSAIAALPPFWSWLAERNFSFSFQKRLLVGLLGFFAGFGLMMVSTHSELQSQRDADTLARNEDRLEHRAERILGQEDIPAELAPVLEELEGRVADHAVIVMRQEDYPALFTKLGESAFNRANALAPWAAIEAATNPSCRPTVDLVAVSDQSTPEKIEWFVDCENGERIQVREDQAELTRQLWADPNGALAQKARARPETADSPANTHEIDAAQEAVIVGSCDRATEAALTSQGSFDPAWSYDLQQDRNNGRAMVKRRFEAKNGFGAEISSEYECLIDTQNMDLVSLRVEEPTGWKTLFQR